MDARPWVAEEAEEYEVLASGEAESRLLVVPFDCVERLYCIYHLLC